MSLIKHLEEKIDTLLQAYEQATSELESLRKDAELLRAEGMQKDLQISALYEEMGNRDRAVEALHNRIAEVLKTSAQDKDK